MVEITRKVEFDAGHRIPNHESKCKNLHGHRYVLECTVTGPIVDTSGHSSEGMVVDFGVLKKLMLEKVAEKWDHALLLWNEDPLVLGASMTEDTPAIPSILDVLPEDHKTVLLECIPTAENLVALAHGLLYLPLKKQGLTLARTRLYETPNCWADYLP